MMKAVNLISVHVLWGRNTSTEDDGINKRYYLTTLMAILICIRSVVMYLNTKVFKYYLNTVAGI